MTGSGTIRAGMGGWVYEPWQGTFYPERLPAARQLGHAARQVPTIEVNGTYYRGQTPKTFAKWASEVPDGFVFSLKAHMAVTNKRVLAEAGESVAKFFETGPAELGDRLGPIVWQFMDTKAFDPVDFAAWLAFLPAESGGMKLRHVINVRHPSFLAPEFVALAERHRCAICYEHHGEFPEIADVTGEFVYARLQRGDDANENCYPEPEFDAWAARARIWSEGGEPADLPKADPARVAERRPRDVFVYFITEGKARAPFGAMALMRRAGFR